jgi:D-alanyl-D-alanine carboxypeptidase/D-alanyl-D-alanine-endopeptidase (penicillin-binding protein 4)
MGSPGYESGRWGLLVVDAKTDAVLFERNADQLFRPASVTKLFSTAAALLELGPDYRFETPVVRRGEVGKDGTLHGDLILVAQGDPSMGGRTGPGGELLFVDNDHSYASANSRSAIVAAEPLAGLDHLAREVQAAGIKAVRGDVLIDDRIFEPAASTGSGPQRVVPIVINDNVVDVIVTPGAKPGDPASVRLLPETTFVTADAVVSTGPEGSTKDVSVRSVGPRRFKVRGQVPAGSGPSFHIYEVDEPVSFARALFIEQLRARGVRVEASPLSENNQDALPPRDQIPTLPRVAQYVSPPLRQYLRVILKVSQNLHASMLPLLVAAHRNQRTLEEGLRQEGALLQSLGLEISKFSFGGGAGGSPADLVTPRATVALLKAMTKRPEYPAYYEALPILGRDGTLAQSVSAESPARGHVRAKTGTFYVHDGLTGKTILTSKALAGYLETASGRSVVFAFFLNDVPLRLDNGDISEATAAAGRLLGKLCEAVYDDTAQADPNSSQVLP